MVEHPVNELSEIVFGRLVHDDVADRVADLVLAATEGDASLDGALAGETVTRPALEASSKTPHEPLNGIYLSEIAVTGVRGIAVCARLGLTPRPGLTLVVGRNGSGKSTFAEATELALAGTCSRWEGRPALWKEGWSNLHFDGRREIAIKLRQSMQTTDTLIQRSWEIGDELAASKVTVQQPGEKREAVDTLGLGNAWLSFRPFLSYNDLGGLLESGPSKLYDAIKHALGTDDIDAVASRLRVAHKALETRAKDVKTRAANLQRQLEAIADARAPQAIGALKGRFWDLEAISALISGDVTQRDDALVWLNEILSLRLPELDDVSLIAQDLDDAATALTAAGRTDATRALQLAELLETALAFHDEHTTETDCPVCGTPDRLDATWIETTVREAARLRLESEELTRAQRRVTLALNAANDVIDKLPSSLRVTQIPLEVAAVTQAWTEWESITGVTDPVDIAKRLRTTFPLLTASLTSIQESARIEHDRRVDVWAPIAEQLAAWLVTARHVLASRDDTTALKTAYEWTESFAATIRDERFAPIAQKVRAIWDLLRRDSNVSIEGIQLVGRTVTRKVQLDVNVDGVEGAALSVMSQGELHALALSMFLPRATLDASPFRFVMIDDPVQAMDAARVDGLAAVLNEIAQHRQVIVFTHDERLSAACRHLGVTARVLEVTRWEHSQVVIRTRTSPFDDLIEDAFAVTKDNQIPSGVKRQILPGLCRAALEAACTDVVWRRRLHEHDSHLQIELLLDSCQRLVEYLALALFGDLSKTAEVLGTVDRRIGKWAADTVVTLNKGTHEGAGDEELGELVSATRQLVKKLTTP